MCVVARGADDARQAALRDFGGVALGLVLAMVGLFGVISFGASRRMREIAIRTSLGASRSSVIGLVLRDPVVVAGTGMALGMVVSVLVTPPLSLFPVDGLSVRDPLS